MNNKFSECECDKPRPRTKPEYQKGFMILCCKNCGNCIAWESLGEEGI